MTLIRLLIAICIMPLTAFAQIPSGGIIGHWSFTNNTNDTSTNMMHATPRHVGITTGKQGAPNTAYRFDSVASYMSVPYNALMNSGELTICAVLKPEKHYTGNCQGNYIVARGTAGTQGSYITHFYDNAYNNCGVADTSLYVFGQSVGNVLSPDDSFKAATKVHTDQWYCVVTTYTSSHVKVYVNGAYVSGSKIAAVAMGTSTDSLVFGKYLPGGSGYPYNFKGVMDDVAIYNRVLADTEINNYCTKAPLYGVELTDTTDNPDTTTHLAHVAQPHTLQLYPNPGKGIFVIEGNASAPVSDIMVMNMQGVVVYRSKATAKDGKLKMQVDLNHISAGNYILRISNEVYAENIRLIIK